MPTVRIPTPLRKLTDGEATVEVAGGDVREVVAALQQAHPGLGERILDDRGELRRFVNVFVRDEDVRFQDGLDTPVGEADTVSIVPAVAGGADRGRDATEGARPAREDRRRRGPRSRRDRGSTPGAGDSPAASGGRR